MWQRTYEHLQCHHREAELRVDDAFDKGIASLLAKTEAMAIRAETPEDKRYEQPAANRAESEDHKGGFVA